MESSTYRKLTKLRQLVGRWLQEHDMRPTEVRIDMIAVLFPRGAEPTVDHVKGLA